jgi:hypothetical protein
MMRGGANPPCDNPAGLNFFLYKRQVRPYIFTHEREDVSHHFGAIRPHISPLLQRGFFYSKNDRP